MLRTYDKNSRLPDSALRTLDRTLICRLSFLRGLAGVSLRRAGRRPRPKHSMNPNGRQREYGPRVSQRSPHQSVQPVTFVAEKNCGGQFPVPLDVRLLRLRGGSNYPDVTFFQLLYQSNEISYSRHRNIFQRACGNLSDHACQTNGASFSDKDPMNARRTPPFAKSIHVARILDPVQSQHQWRIGVPILLSSVSSNSSASA